MQQVMISYHIWNIRHCCKFNDKKLSKQL